MSNLLAALMDLDRAKSEAKEEGFPVPSAEAMQNANRLLRALHAISPQRYEIYPAPEGEITIDAPGGRGRSVLLICESDGGVLCLVNMGKRSRRARYETADTLPDGFIREALEELAKRKE